MTSYRPNRFRAKRTCSLILLKTPCLRRYLLINTTSPNQDGVEKLGSDVVWIFIESLAILVMLPSLMRTGFLFSLKEAYFYADVLPVTLVAQSVGFVSRPILEAEKPPARW